MVCKAVVLAITRHVRNVCEMTKLSLVFSLTILFSRFLIFFSANWMACPIGVSISEGGEGVSFAAASTPGFSLEDEDVVVAGPGGFPEAVSLAASEVVMMVSEGMTLVAAVGGGRRRGSRCSERNLISANKNASGGLVGKQQNEAESRRRGMGDAEIQGAQ